MRGVTWFLALFVVAVCLALFTQQYAGSVFFAFESKGIYRVNFNTFVIANFLFVCALYALIHILAATIRIPARVKAYARRRRLKAARHSLRQAGLSFFEGRYQKSEQQAKRAIEDEYAPENRVLALMFAAKSSHLMRDTLERDKYLEQIKVEPGRLQLPRYILEAESAFVQKDYEKMQEALAQANILAPNLTLALKLELQMNAAKKRPQKVLSILEKLVKVDAIDAKEAGLYRLSAYKQQLAALVHVDEIKTWLKSVPDAEQKGPLSVFVAQKYQQLGLFREAAAWVSKFYSINNEPELLPVFAKSVEHLDAAEQRKALEQSEGWLKAHPNDAALLLCLGKLAMAHQLWGKAQSYLEASIAVSPSLDAHLTLAKLLRQLEKSDQALIQENKALNLAQKMLVGNHARA